MAYYYVMMLLRMYRAGSGAEPNLYTAGLARQDALVSATTASKLLESGKKQGVITDRISLNKQKN